MLARQVGRLHRSVQSFLWVAAAFAFPVFGLISDGFLGLAVNDSSVFRYLGWRLAEGSGGYANAWDCKGPVLVALNAFGCWIFPDCNIGPSVIFCAIWSASILLFYRMAARLKIMFAPFLTFIMTFLAYTQEGSFINNQEVVAIFFSLLGLNVLGKGLDRCRLFAFGACVAMPFLAKANLVSFGAATAIVWVVEWYKENYSANAMGGTGVRKCLRGGVFERALYSFSGFLLILIVVSAVFSSGGLYEMWDASLSYNLFERSSDIKDTWIDWWSGYLYGKNYYKGETYEMWLWIITCVGGSLAGLLLYLRKFSLNYEMLLLSIWTLLEFAMAVCSKGFFPHYKMVSFVPVLLLAGLMLDKLRSKRLRLVLVVILAFISVYRFYGLGNFTFHLARNAAKSREDIELIKQVLPDGRPVAVWGKLATAEVLFRLRLMTPQKYFSGRLYYNHAFAARKYEIEEELASAVKQENIEFLITDCDIQDVPVDSSNNRFKLVLQTYNIPVRVYKIEHKV